MGRVTDHAIGGAGDGLGGRAVGLLEGYNHGNNRSGTLDDMWAPMWELNKNTFVIRMDASDSNDTASAS